MGLFRSRRVRGSSGASRRSIASTAAAVVVASGVAVPIAVQSPARAAAPTVATDSTKVPHYFGPWPNWALSQLTSPTAEVKITGAGTGATAAATVDPVSGAITGIDITDPGKGYSPTDTAVTITGGSTTDPAAASATVTTTGAVTGFTVTGAGSGYKSFKVVLTDTVPPAASATAQGSGGVDAVQIVDGGANYTMPTVEFALPDLPTGTQAKGHVPMKINGDTVDGIDPVTGAVTTVIVDDAGSGYLTAPDVVVHNGTAMDPISGATLASVTSTLKLTAVDALTFGSTYTAAPAVDVQDPVGSGVGASATAQTDIGAVTGVTVTTPGSGYLKVGIRKFQDELPIACDPASAAGCPTAAGAKYIPLGVPAAKLYSGQAADEYVVGLVQYRTRFNSDIDPTLVRGYVQIETPDNAAVSQHYPLTNELLDGTKDPVLDTNGQQVYAVTPPQWLGPFIVAKKNTPVRVVFHNYLPTGAKGDLFLPVDPSMMGAGMGPMGMGAAADAANVLDGIRNPDCQTEPKSDTMCFKDNRATLHLHGGTTPWISDGTPHQWITPAGEKTAWPQGVSVKDVPDMVDENAPADAAGNKPVLCSAKDDGCQTFYYTNQQSARLLFYHDHSWGITRLNVYAGEAAGYVITDATEQKLVDSGTIPAAADTLPLVVQDRTFRPDDAQLALQDPTWDTARWGTKGSFWYHHVYMPAQNPGDPSGMSAYGRWMYGPWFWPPATGTKYGPIKNPYYDPACKLDDPTTWTYQTDPFCEPELIPGTPNISAGMEQFNDTPIVNGVAYPTVTLQPKSYRLRLLNAANDRFFNLQWYTADPNQGDGTTEVALKPSELAAAQTDPNVSPTPLDANNNAAGPDWIQIGSEGGFLPKPAVIDGQQPTTWIIDPTRFDVGNVDKHSMLLAPAERSDVIVDFSKFAGRTLILYNDAPAAFPARVASYDYYTGAPDMSPNGAPKILPGYGPNTRTVMQVKIANTAPAGTFDLTKLQNAFKHTLTGTGVFESGQHPVIVGQAGYNSAYGTTFAGGSNCNLAGSTTTTCDGLVRVADTGKFSFNTLRNPTKKMTLPLEPKAIHDEMNSTTFDEFGRMQANLGIEAQPPTPGAQNVTLYPFVNPGTEFIDGTGLPSAADKVTPIGTAPDGTQIWRITHNGVDTHPIHFHLFDVQLLNRVTWDNIVIPPDDNELGWKDTVRTSPLEDTIVALRPVIPTTPFEVPNSVRDLNPMMPEGSTDMFNNMDVNGNPTDPVTNQLVNFGWEYVYHCHILSHEEMDMMRPVTLAVPPRTPDGLTWEKVPDAGGVLRYKVGWSDNAITETSTELQRSTDGTTWTTVATLDSPLNVANTHGARSLVDPGSDATSDPAVTNYQYRVVAKNTVGYGGQFPSMTVQSASAPLLLGATPPPLAPSNLTATLANGPAVDLAWTDGSANETGFVVERSAAGANTWTKVGATLAANTTSFKDTTVIPGTYDYRIGATNAGGTTYGNVATVAVVPPAAPTGLTANLAAGPAAALAWTDAAANETGYRVERAPTGTTTWTALTTLTANSTAYSDTTVQKGTTYDYRVVAVNQVGEMPSGTVTLAVVAPPAPTGLTATLAAGPGVVLAWTDNATNETAYVVERSNDNGATWSPVKPLGANASGYTDTSGLLVGATYTYRVGVTNVVGTTYSSNVTMLVALAPAPTGLTATLVPATLAAQSPSVNLAWTDNATTETGTLVQRSTDGGATWTTLTTIAATVGTGARTMTDLAPLPGATNLYRVGAANVLGYAWSGTASVTLVALPGAPTLSRAEVLGGPRVRLTWTDGSTNEAGFSFQRSTDGGTTWTQWSTSGAVGGTGTVAQRSDTTVTLGTTYLYRVGARNASGYVYSGVLTVTVAAPATAPTVTASAAATSATQETLSVSWTAVSGANDYQVQYRRTAGGGTTTITTTATSQNITNLAKVGWSVRVGARNGLGTTWSSWTAVAAAP